ncbi:YoaK family protein [Gordonia sp. DT219]|uniref:YoaK family protein n=1 Tax=Gordonia sp. DT219 TaxID=3416658 RepID=UPI003CEAAE4C
MLLATVLAAIAGYLDAVGFLHLGGYFVSFMSGNTTRAAVEAVNGRWVSAGRAAGLIGLFFVGVVAGSLLSRSRDGRSMVLWATTVIIGGAATARSLGVGVPAIVVIAVAMGLLNATFQRGGEVSIGITYMTGTLVKAGQRLVDGFFGGSRTAWLRYLAMWIALAMGAVIGAYVYTRLPDAVLWIAAGALLLTTSITTVVRRRSESSGHREH